MLSSIPGAVLLASWLSLVAVAAPAPHSGKSKAHGWNDWTTSRAIYLITNDASNAVVALPIAADGTLSAGTVTPIGGQGSAFINGATGEPAGPDALASQAALTLAGNNIFAVSPGSNTVSMLSFDPRDPTKLTVIGQPVALPGQFPNTVAASAKNSLVCVGTSGSENGVSCSSFSAKGLSPMDGLRSFDLVQSTPPVGPTNTVSQVFFSEDESRLFATVKGNPAVNDTGYFSVFSVEQGAHWGAPATLSSQDVRSSPAGTAVLFGSFNIPGTSNVFASDASFGAAVLSVPPSSNEASTVAKQAIDGQKATCWAILSPATNSAFVADVGINRLVEMSLTDASILSIVDLSADQDPGLIDMAVGGNFLYALSPGNGTTAAAIAVLDVSGGQGSAKLVQHFGLGAMGVDKNAQGLAIF